MALRKRNREKTGLMPKQKTIILSNPENPLANINPNKKRKNEEKQKILTNATSSQKKNLSLRTFFFLAQTTYSTNSRNSEAKQFASRPKTKSRDANRKQRNLGFLGNLYTPIYNIPTYILKHILNKKFLKSQNALPQNPRAKGFPNNYQRSGLLAKDGPLTK